MPNKVNPKSQPPNDESPETKKFKPNPTEKINRDDNHWKNQLGEKWVNENVAILIIHGIGHQNPLETVDQFARGLVDAFRTYGGHDVELCHMIADKPRSDRVSVWFDNYIRLKLNGKPNYIDVYEYYWAHNTEDQANLVDIRKWVNNVVKAARKYYRDKMHIGETYRDKSIFFDKNGKFKKNKYFLFLYFFFTLIPAISFFIEGLADLLGKIPFLGGPLKWLFDKLSSTVMKSITNVISDITIYNTTDVKSKFYNIRKNILSGAVNAIRYLLESKEGSKYNKIYTASHSLGSQVAFDAINRLNHIINKGKLVGYDQKGNHRSRNNNIKDIFSGFITFGSPLDKIAFFLNQNIPEEQFLRRQMVKDFHCFKQRDWDVVTGIPVEYKLQNPIKRLFDEVPWYNYFDRKDYVSGSLDYYHKLTNIDCQFPAGFFPHSNYWNFKPMYAHFLSKMVVK